MRTKYSQRERAEFYKSYLYSILTGGFVFTFIKEIGSIITLAFETIKAISKPPFRWHLYFKTMEFIGINSIFIVILTGIFSGMVFALQTGRILQRFNAGSAVGAIVAMSLARELAPVLTSLMVTARAGSAMAAQIGTMKVTQQIDALNVMAVDPIHYLVVPRVIASVLMLPLLTGLCDFIGVLGSYVVAVKLLGVNEAVFLNDIYVIVNAKDIMQGIEKSAVFGFIMSIIGCYMGLKTMGGAEGVGKSTTHAVVLASILILISDYLMVATIY